LSSRAEPRFAAESKDLGFLLCRDDRSKVNGFLPLAAEIIPFRIHGFNQRHFLLATPVFELFFTTYCVADILILLKINQADQVVASSVAILDYFLFVLIGAAHY